MQLVTLDSIVRRKLLETGLPIHWYAEYLFHCASAMRELAKDSLQIINSARLPINTYGAADLPQDFMDDIGCYQPWGGLLQPIPKQDNINPIRIHNPTTGAFTPYTTNNVNTPSNTIYGYNPGAVWFWNINDWSEPTGRYFGAGGGANSGYKVIKERRQIQFVGLPETDSIALLYISNGQSVDNASQIDWLAFQVIGAYADWKRSANAAIKDSYEAHTYYNERRLFRSSMNSITLDDIRNTLRKNYMASAKN